MTRAATGYGPLLRTPGAAAFYLAAALGRVGIAMTGLGLVWLLHDRTGSYATAGLAAAGFALAEALVGPHLARLIDRFGQTRTLPFYLLGHGAAVAGLLLSTTPAAAVVAATCAGTAVPQLGALSAARWAHLLRADRAEELPSAFSLESLANATAFLLGPVLVTALGAAGHPAPATALAATLVLGGGAALAVQRRTAPPAARARTEGEPRERSGLLRPAFLLLALLNLAIGLYFGTMGVAVTAFAVGQGTPAVATPIIAAASLSGLLGGWLYGLRKHPTPAHRQLVLATIYLTATAALLPLAPSALWLGAAVVLTEAAIPPTLVLLTVLTERAVRPTALTQAFTWNNSASAAGSALAAALAGRAADTWDASAALLLAPVAGLLLVVLSVLLGRVLDRVRGQVARPGRPAGSALSQLLVRRGRRVSRGS
ncbi:MFS transporter [Promicromonospora sp. NPDC060271]|uniref:MFS transporter n=1 Tax=Promicromonospora sp. NPDC060271 TaxID=3347089 RepID=UPI00366A1627